MDDVRVSLGLQVGLYVVALPAGVVAAVALGGLRLGRGQVALGLAVAAGVVAALIGNGGVPALPPVDTLHWIPFLVGAAALLLVPLDARPFRGADLLAGLLTAALVAVAGWLLLRPLLGQQAEPWKWLATTGALAVLAPWLAFARAQGRANGPADLSALALTTLAASGAAVLAHSALLAQVLGAVAVALGVATLLAWRKPALAAGHAATGAAYVALAALVLYTLAYADLPIASAVLLLLAPRLGAVAARGATGFRALAVAGVVALLPGGAAVALAYAANAANPSESKQKYDYDY